MKARALKIFEKPEENFKPLVFPDISRSFMSFCESLSSLSRIEDFLFVLKAHLPKKFKIGELLLFYDSESMGWRRAYIKNKNFYEQAVQAFWPESHQIRFSDQKENHCFSQELGRPFSKALMIPLHKALLLVEVDRSFLGSDLIDFFQERKAVLDLVFKRLALNSRLSRASYLWSQLFFHWEEPIAILKNYKSLKSNQAFQQALLAQTDFLQKKQLSGSIETKKGSYHLHYYKINSSIGILYAQDITKYLVLKAQWLQTKKMASLCRLGKNMAHQLNNPLSGVKAMTQILKKDLSLSNFKKDLEELERGVLRSQRIIQSLLSFSSFEGQRQSCDLNQVLKDTLSLLKSSTQRIHLKKNLHPRPLMVTGDFSLFQQMLYNLILNACQSLSADKENSHPTLSISTHLLSDCEFCLKVKDNGLGIPKAHLEKIFRPFWSSKEKGTGFGLSLTQKFVQSCGGKIFVSSREKEYSCFTLLFPLSP